MARCSEDKMHIYMQLGDKLLCCSQLEQTEETNLVLTTELFQGALTGMVRSGSHTESGMNILVS